MAEIVGAERMAERRRKVADQHAVNAYFNALTFWPLFFTAVATSTLAVLITPKG